jgi:hypothetical protein
MKLSPHNARFNNATRDEKASTSGRDHQVSRKKSNQGCGGLNTKYLRPTISSLQHNDIRRLRGGTTTAMDIADEAESCLAPPPTRFSYKGDSPWAAPTVVEADSNVFMRTLPQTPHQISDTSLAPSTSALPL